jgi:hypothetical protein
VCDVDLLDILETIREGPLVRDPDLTAGLARRSFGDTFMLTPMETSREKEGSQ